MSTQRVSLLRPFLFFRKIAVGKGVKKMLHVKKGKFSYILFLPLESRKSAVVGRGLKNTYVSLISYGNFKYLAFSIFGPLGPHTPFSDHFQKFETSGEIRTCNLSFPKQDG